jgi:hypothetical protein
MGSARGLRSGSGGAWGELAKWKQQELDENMARLQTMRGVLDRVWQCQCAELVACGRMAAVMKPDGDVCRHCLCHYRAGLI